MKERRHCILTYTPSPLEFQYSLESIENLMVRGYPHFSTHRTSFSKEEKVGGMKLWFLDLGRRKKNKKVLLSTLPNIHSTDISSLLTPSPPYLSWLLASSLQSSLENLNRNHISERGTSSPILQPQECGYGLVFTGTRSLVTNTFSTRSSIMQIIEVLRLATGQGSGFTDSPWGTPHALGLGSQKAQKSLNHEYLI